MTRRLAPALTLAVAALAACQGASDAERSPDPGDAGPRRPGNFNALSAPRSRDGALPPRPARPDVSGPLASHDDSRLGVPSFLWNRRTGPGAPSSPGSAGPRRSPAPTSARRPPPTGSPRPTWTAPSSSASATTG